MYGKLEHFLTKRVSKAVMAFVAALSFVGIVWLKSGIFFETNDDRYIASLLSGVISGKTDPIVFNVNFMLMYPLSCLYRISCEVPWYGILLVACYVTGYFALLLSFYERCRHFVEMVAVTVFMGILSISYWYLIGQIQYTSVTIFLAAAGYACLLSDDGKPHWLRRFLCLQILACIIRKQAMFLVQPIGLSTYFLYLLFMKGQSGKEIMRKYIRVAWALLMALSVEFFGSFLGGYFGSELWEYKQFDDNRRILFDYREKPSYDEVSDILNRYQVTKAQYNGYLTYSSISCDVSVACEKEMVAYVQEKEPFLIKDIFQGLKSLYTQDQSWNINRLSFVLMLAVVLWGIFTKNLSLLAAAAGMEIGKVAVWGFLFYQGRILHRVSVPLFAAESLMMAALLVGSIAESIVSHWKKYVCVLLTLFVILPCGFFSARQQYRYVRMVNEGQTVFMDGLREIIEYCENREEKKFVLDAASVASYKGSAFETGIYHPSNYIVSGGWFSCLPTVRDRVRDYLEDAEGIYLVIYVEWAGEDNPTVCYFTELTGNSPVLVDHIDTSPGVSYAVLYYAF